MSSRQTVLFVNALLVCACFVGCASVSTTKLTTKPANTEVIDQFVLPPLPPGKTAADFNRDTTIVQRKEGDDTITEYRLKGKLYKMTVKSANGSSYTLVDDKGDGKFVRAGEVSSKISVPMWVVLSW
jgi:Protein of unknown function (DUF2782)